MKSSLWTVIVVVAGIVGFLVGYTVSAYSGAAAVATAHAAEPEPGKAAESGGYGAEKAAPKAAAGGYGEAPAPQKAAAGGYGEAPAPKAAAPAAKKEKPATPAAGY